MNALGMAGSFLQEARIGRRSPRFCLGRLWSGWLDRGEVPDPQHDLRHQRLFGQGVHPLQQDRLEKAELLQPNGAAYEDVEFLNRIWSGLVWSASEAPTIWGHSRRSRASNSLLSSPSRWATPARMLLKESKRLCPRMGA